MAAVSTAVSAVGSSAPAAPEPPSPLASRSLPSPLPSSSPSRTRLRAGPVSAAVSAAAPAAVSVAAAVTAAAAAVPLAAVANTETAVAVGTEVSVADAGRLTAVLISRTMGYVEEEQSRGCGQAGFANSRVGVRAKLASHMPHTVAWRVAGSEQRYAGGSRCHGGA